MHSIAVCLLIFATIFTGHCASWGGYSSSKTATKNLLAPHKLLQCKNQICLNVEGYPEEHINTAMEKEQSIKSLLGGSVFNATVDVVIGNRIRPINEGTSTQLCNTERPLTYRARAMRNTRGHWKVIVNTHQYHQTFTVEACRSVAEPDLVVGTSEYCTDFNMKCKQNYQPLSLVIYEQGRIRFDKFFVPTTCKCCGE